MIAPDVLTVEEAADALDVSVATIRRWCADGRLRAEKVGRQWLIDSSALPAVRGSASRRSAPLTTDHIRRAVKHVQGLDIGELWIPDSVHHQDSFQDAAALVDRVRGLVGEGGPFGPAEEVSIAKSVFFERAASLLSLPDHIAYQAVIETFADRIEQRLLPCVFSSRLSDRTNSTFTKPGVDQWLKWRDELKNQITSGANWVVKTDITSFFDNIQHQQLFLDLQELGADASVLDVLRRMLRTWQQSPNTGLPQGPNASRILANFYLLPVDDLMAGRNDWQYTRYMDDIRITSSSRHAAIQAVRDLQSACRKRGLNLAASKTELVEANRVLAELSRNPAAELKYRDANLLVRSDRAVLLRILESSLQSAKERIDQRSAKFSLYRLFRLREDGAIQMVLRHLELLAPVASTVALYLAPFIGRDRVVYGLRQFFEDEERNTSTFLSAWLLAALTDRRNPPEELIHYARQVSMDANQPTYHRGLAVGVMARGRRPVDVQWLYEECQRAFDPRFVRHIVLALARIGRVDRALQRRVSDRFPELEKTFEYIAGRQSFPSVLRPGVTISVDPHD